MKESWNISRPTLTTGLELGDPNSCYCALEEVGQITGAASARPAEDAGSLRGNAAQPDSASAYEYLRPRIPNLVDMPM